MSRCDREQPTGRPVQLRFYRFEILAEADSSHNHFSNVLATHNVIQTRLVKPSAQEGLSAEHSGFAARPQPLKTEQTTEPG